MVRVSVQSEDVFRAAGFSPPKTVWSRADSRGSEYGRYEVFINDCHCGESKVTVVRYSPDSPTPAFEMHFNSYNDFSEWAKLF